MSESKHLRLKQESELFCPCGTLSVDLAPNDLRIMPSSPIAVPPVILEGHPVRLQDAPAQHPWRHVKQADKFDLVQSGFAVVTESLYWRDIGMMRATVGGPSGIWWSDGYT